MVIGHRGLLLGEFAQEQPPEVLQRAGTGNILDRVTGSDPSVTDYVGNINAGA